jgi:hypothetical protein
VDTSRSAGLPRRNLPHERNSIRAPVTALDQLTFVSFSFL